MVYLGAAFGLFWKAFFSALMEHLPQIKAFWLDVNTTTITEAPPAPKDLKTAANKELQDAMDVIDNRSAAH